MGFFGIGTGEILLILVVALIIWGPRRLPEIARTMGKAVRTLRKATFDLTTAVTKEISLEENTHSPHPPRKPDARTAGEPPSNTKKTLTRRSGAKSKKPGEASAVK